jgi:diguanylate cyclase (GGDEF)-like protein
MQKLPDSLPLLTEIVDRINVGVFVVDRQMNIVLWNTFMENYSERSAQELVGNNLFEQFPELPKAWFEQKINNVLLLKNFAFTSWEHRPYLFKFQHNRPITGGIDVMRQNCTLLPIKGESGAVEYVCVTVFDATDTSIYQEMLQDAIKSLAEASNRDGLTGVFNRRFLQETLEAEFSRAKRYSGKLSFIIIDLDHFKAINDNHGHLAGDEALKVAAKRIGEDLRLSDIMGRYGGEEFGVVLPETTIEGARITAERIREALQREPVIYQNKEIKLSASLGVTELRPDTCSVDALLEEADKALYQSKENGRNQVTVHQPDETENMAQVSTENADTDKTESNSEPVPASTTTAEVESSSEDVTYITVGHD